MQVLLYIFEIFEFGKNLINCDQLKGFHSCFHVNSYFFLFIVVCCQL